MRTAESHAASLTMRPEQVALALIAADSGTTFEQRWFAPGTRCREIMTAILNGEPLKDIAKRFSDKPNTIRVYALVLSRKGYDVSVPDLEPEPDEVPTRIPPRLLALPKETIEAVRTMRESGIGRRAIIAKLGMPRTTYDDIVYYTLHDHWRAR